MSSQVVDEKVVEMRFQNSQFEKGVKESMSTIDKLKASLNFSGASKSFNQITEAANRVSFKGLERNVDELHNYINLKAVAMFTVVNNMVSQIQSSITNMVKQFTIVPISTGFQEYELKMGSVQTIMAATGESLETVNKYLQELNEYSDKTIYSFSDMTQNIGKFTNAGVKLEDAVLAMKGISNEAAISGANANEASRAMYNLAQSLSMGYVQYIDWKSIENANMATVQFKQNLADVAVQLGAVQKSSDGYYEVAGKSYNLQQLFKDALKDQWLTTDVLIKTLRDYADETTEIGKKAYAAAQDVKTFTMMMDTLKEAAQSGWAYTWEIFIGDFNEAKEMFTEFSQMFGKMIDDSSEARNSLLRGVLGSKWDRLISYINAAGIATEEFEGRLTRVLREAGFPVDEMVKKWGSLGEAIRHMGNVKDYVIKVIQSFTAPIVETGEAVGAVTGKLEDFQKVVNQVIRGEFGSGKKRVEALTEAGWNYAQVQELVNKVWERNGKNWKNTTITMEDLVDVLGKMSAKELEQVGITEEQVRVFQELQEQAALTGSDLNKLIENLYKPSGRELIFDTIRNAVNALVQIFQIAKQAWLEVFPQKGTEELYGILEAINKFSKALSLNEDKADKLRRTFRGIFSILGIVSDIIQTALRVLFPGLIKGHDMIQDGILSVTAVLGDMIYGFREFLKSGTLVADIVSYLKDCFLAGVFGIKQWIEELRQVPFVADVINTISNALQGVLDFLKYVFDNFYDQMSDGKTNMIEAFINVANKIGDKLKVIADTLPSIQELREVFKMMFEDFEKSGDNVVVGFLLGLGNALLEVPKKITEFAALVVNTFKDYLGIASPSKLFFQLGKYVIMGFVDGIFHYMSETDRAFNEWRIQMLKYFLGKEMKREFEKIRDFFKGVFDDIVEFLRVFGTSFGEVLGNIRDIIRNEDIIKPILTIATDLVKLLLLLKLLRGWNNIGEGISDFGEGIKRLGKAFQKVAGGIKDFFKSLSAKNYTKAIGTLALSLALVMGMVLLMTKMMNDDDISRAAKIAEMMKGIIVIFGLVAGGLILVHGICSKFLDTTGKNLAKNILSIGLMIVSIAGAAWIMAKALQEIAAIPRRDIYKAMDVLDSIMQTFAVLTVVLVTISALNEGSISGAAWAVLAIAVGVKLIIDIIKKYFYDKDGDLFYFNEEKVNEIKKAFGAVFLIIASLAGALAIIGMVAGAGVRFAGVGVAVLGLALAIDIVIGAINYMDRTLSSTKHPVGSMVAVLGVLLVTGIALGMVMDMSRGTSARALLSIGAIFLAFAASLKIIVSAIRDLKGLKIDDNTATLFITLIGIMSAVLVILALISAGANMAGTKSLFNDYKMLLGIAAVMVAISASIAIIAKTMKEYNLSRVAGAIAILIGIAAGLVILTKVLSTITAVNTVGVGAIVAIAVAIGVLAYSIYELQNVDTDRLLAIATAFTICLGSLMMLSDLVTTAWPAVAAIIAIAGAIWLIGDAVKQLSTISWEDLGKGIFGVLEVIALAVVGLFAVLAVASMFSSVTWPAVAAIAALAFAILAVAIAAEYLAHGDNILSKFFREPQEAIKDLVDWIDKLCDALYDLITLEGKYDPAKHVMEAYDYITKGQTGGGRGSSKIQNYDNIADAITGWWQSKKGKKANPEPVYTEVSGTETKRYSSPNQIEVHTLTKEATEAGKQANEAMTAELIKPVPLDEAEAYVQSFTEPLTDSADGSTKDFLTYMKEQASKYAEGTKIDISSWDKFLNIDGIQYDEKAQKMINLMSGGLENADMSVMSEAFGEYLDDPEMAKMFSESGMDFGTLFGMNFNNALQEELKKGLSQEEVQANMDWANQNAWKLGNSAVQIPVIEKLQTASAASPMGNNMTGLLGNMAAGGFNAVQFPETMNTTSPDVVNAVNALHQDIQTLYVKIANLQVRLDTGALVGNLTPQINQSMGKMAVYKVRGN